MQILQDFFLGTKDITIDDTMVIYFAGNGTKVPEIGSDTSVPLICPFGFDR